MTDAAHKIAERVPLPECPDAPDWSSMQDDAIRAYGLAVAAEALRGAEAVGTVRSDTGVTLTVDRTGHYYGARIPSGTKLYTALPAPLPAGSVEVTEAMVERLRKIIRERWSLYLGPECARDALTSALQEPGDG